MNLQQQPWNHGEMNVANGAVTYYWNQSNKNFSATSADEDAGPNSFSEPSYFNPASSSLGPSTESKQDDKQSGKQESGGGSNNSNSSKAAAAAAARAQQAGSGDNWLGGFFSKFKPKTQMKLPDYKNRTIVWDNKKSQWVDTGKDSEDEAATLAPPPKDACFQSLPPMPMTPAFSSPAPPSFTASNRNNNEGNRFGLNKGRGGRNAYVNPPNIKISSFNSLLPLLHPFPAVTPSLSATGTPQFFVPSPAMMDPSSAPVVVPASSSLGPSTESKQDDKQSGKQESGGGSNNSNSSKAAAAAAARAQQAGSGDNWLGGFFSKFKPKTQMKLPDYKNQTIVWVDTGKDSEDEAATLAPPPKDACFQSLPPMPMTPAFSSSAPPSFTASNRNNNEGNRFGLNKGRGGRNAYVNPPNIKISSVNSPLPLLDPFSAVTPSLSATGTPQFSFCHRR